MAAPAWMKGRGKWRQRARAAAGRATTGVPGTQSASLHKYRPRPRKSAQLSHSKDSHLSVFNCSTTTIALQVCTGQV